MAARPAVPTRPLHPPHHTPLRISGQRTPCTPRALRTGVAATGLALLAAAGCVQREAVVTSRQVIGAGDRSGSESLRPGRNLPTAFEVVVAPTVSSDCPPQLRDPGMETLLTLQTSVLQPVRDSLGVHYRAVGDYSVQPRGRYGDEHPGEGLRIDCARLRALGVVRLGGATRP